MPTSTPQANHSNSYTQHLTPTSQHIPHLYTSPWALTSVRAQTRTYRFGLVSMAPVIYLSKGGVIHTYTHTFTFTTWLGDGAWARHLSQYRCFSRCDPKSSERYENSYTRSLYRLRVRISEVVRSTAFILEGLEKPSLHDGGLRHLASC